MVHCSFVLKAQVTASAKTTLILTPTVPGKPGQSNPLVFSKQGSHRQAGKFQTSAFSQLFLTVPFIFATHFLTGSEPKTLLKMGSAGNGNEQHFSFSNVTL